MASISEDTVVVLDQDASERPLEDSKSGPDVGKSAGEDTSFEKTEAGARLEWYKRMQLVGYKEWVPKLVGHTLRTEFVDLSPSNLEALANGGAESGSSEVEAGLTELEGKIDEAIAILGSNGVSVRLNLAAHSSDRLSPEDQDTIRLQVMNQVELERQLGTAADCYRRGTFVRRFQRPESDETEGEEQPSHLPRSALSRQTQSEAHEILLASEPLENAALRALSRVLIGRMRVQSGREAIAMLGNSSSVQYHLKQIRDGNPSWDSKVLQIYLVIREWIPDIPRHPEMCLRGFVYNDSLTALSQVDDVTFFPNLVKHKVCVQQRVEKFFKESVSQELHEFGSYVIDFFVGPQKVLVTSVLPFDQSTGACLFTWGESEAVFRRVGDAPLEFRTISQPNLDCLEILPSPWESKMLTAIAEREKFSETKDEGCLIL